MFMAQILYPIGIQSFSKIRAKGLLYVDKTEYIYRLVTDSQYVFLSRPRRFGKSLLISTIEEYFKGRRELFEGLAISKHECDWTEHPVLHLDLSGCKGETDESLNAVLLNYLSIWEEWFSIPTNLSVQTDIRFKNLIRIAHEKTGKRVVILVDEYDKPLLETVSDEERQKKFRNDLRAFYSNLKSQDEHIRFAMLTGVTKFGHLSIFSDLNNLKDISLDSAYSAICGISEDELHQYFHESVTEFAKATGDTVENIYAKLKVNYDGYHFAPLKSEEVYNPFSVLNCLSSKWFRDYWFSTGTPDFLIKMLRAGDLSLQDLNEYNISLSRLTNVSYDLSNPIPVLYQTGYLTIKSYDREFDDVVLGYPNAEVKKGFYDQLLPIYANIDSKSSRFDIRYFVTDIRQGRAEEFMLRLQSLFSGFPYDSFDLKALERHYQDIIFIIMTLMGFYTRVEYKTAAGRIDMVIETADYIYVFEFKMDRTAREALDQINTKDYLLPFKSDGRQVIKIGANFSSKLRSIEDWLIE